MVLACDASDELRLALCRGRIRGEADHLDVLDLRSADAAASPPVGSFYCVGDHENRSPAFPGQIQCRLKTIQITRPVQHDNRVDVCGHSLRRPDEPARRDSTESGQQNYEHNYGVPETFTPALRLLGVPCLAADSQFVP